MTKKNYLKKEIKMGIVFLIVGIFLSSSCAIPISQKNAIDIMENELKNNNCDINVKGNMTLMLLNFLNKIGFDGTNIYRVLSDMTIIDKAYEYYNNDTIREKIIETKIKIELEINKYPENNRQFLMDFFNINETFSLQSIYDRINSLHFNTVLTDIQTLLKVFDITKNETFYQTRQEASCRFLQLWYTNNFTLEDSYYPLIDFICKIFGVVSLLWAVPLTILGGLVGLGISSFITMIFFSPILIPLSYYIGFIECLKNDPELKQELIEITFMYGLIGLLTYGTILIIDKMFNSDWAMYGWEYILSHTSIIGIGQNKNDYYLLFGENPPFIECVSSIKVKRGNMAMIKIKISDPDTLQYWNPETQKRDYVQLGIDYDNDFIIDKWIDLDIQLPYAIVYEFGYCNILGIKKMNLIARDTLGIYSNWKTLTITVNKDMDRNIIFFPLFHNLLEKFLSL